MLRREASNWLARLQSGSDPDVERRFQRWYEASPAHADAFERVRRNYERAGLLTHSELARERPLEERAPLASTQPRWAFAGAVALAVLVPAAILVTNGAVAPIGTRNTVLLASAVGEIRHVTLEDGSKVTLDTSTAVEVALGRSERRALVRKGRARFEVAPDSRPFIIEAGGATVTSGPAVLDVEALGEHARVEVHSGSATASLASSPQESAAIRVDAGQGFSSVRVPATYPLTGDRSAWTRGMLQFDGTPLGDAVAAANRYSERRIVIRGDLHQLRVTGAFRAGDTAGLAKALAAAFNLSLVQTADGRLILSPAPKKKNGG